MPHINLLPWARGAAQATQQGIRNTRVRRCRRRRRRGRRCRLAFPTAHRFPELTKRLSRATNCVAGQKDQGKFKSLIREKERLLARMRIIQQLQSSRPEIVRVVDSLVETLPDGVFYTGITQQGLAFNVVGVAQSNARVSSLMRQLESSEMFENPNLVEITAITNVTVGGSEVKTEPVQPECDPSQ